MCKSCDNCYWRFGSKNLYYQGRENLYCHFKLEVPEDKVCSCHDYICEECELSYAEYLVGGKKLCSECMLEEEEIESCEVTQYFKDGEYLGDSGDFKGVVSQLDNVEELD